ncbi:MAG TPA: hypothetical protein VHN14_24605, partial [Kofleriaceae bacterium]|nr:hypothetical protein [Kofleriaceae bacterium]
MIGVLAVAQCVIATSPIVATAMAGDARATLTPNAVQLGDRTATPCDSLPAPHPTAIAGWHDQLAVGFRDGGVWTWDGTRFTALAGLPASPIRALAAVGDTLWIGTAEGLWSMDSPDHAPGDRPRNPPKRFDHRTLGHAPITALAADGETLHVGVDPRGEWNITGATAALVSKQALIGCFSGGEPRPPGGCRRGSPEVPIHVTALAEYHHRLVVGTFDDGV